LIISQEKERNAIRREVDTAQATIIKLTQAKVGLEDENKRLQQDVSDAKERIVGFEETIHKCSIRLHELSEQKTSLNVEIGILQGQIAQKSQESGTLDRDLADKQTKIGGEISLLEQKKQKVIQDILERQGQDQKARQGLASWQLRLEEWDKNLRIREAKITEKEAMVSRNYDLLNM
jgi:chromosome segregation ATPase